MQVMTKLTKSKIILGIDPGTSIMGYGLIEVFSKTEMKLLQYGVINLSKYDNHPIKLKKIFERVLSLIDDYHPDEMALEAPFFGKNVQSMLKLGRAQGAAMAAGLYRDIPITEYAPRKVKQSVTGKGTSSKEDVAAMIVRMLKIVEAPKLLDATDALGVAICHHFQDGVVASKGGSWKTFVNQNTERIK